MSITTNKKGFSFEDFEKGLMLAGLITPTTVQEFDELEKLKKFDKRLALERRDTYFKRAVLAAEIVSQLYTLSTFGRVKFQKLVYLCEHAGEMDLQNRYAKFAAGPFDNKFMHSIHSEFKRQKWFDVKWVTNNGIKKPVYTPGERHDKYKEYYSRYFSDHDDSIQLIIAKFKFEKTRYVELVATIYFCLVEIREEKYIYSVDLLLKRFYSWANEKKKFEKHEVLDCLNWMKEEGLIPA